METRLRISIRTLVPDDVQALSRLLRRTLAGLSDRTYPAALIREELDKYTTDVLLRKICQSRSAMLGAFAKDRLVGFALSFGQPSGRWYVEWLGVAAGARRHGIAGLLLKRIESAARRSKCHKIWFETSLKNIPAANAYLRYGYRIEGVMRNEFSGGDFLYFGKSLSRRRFSARYGRQPDFPARIVIG